MSKARNNEIALGSASPKARVTKDPKRCCLTPETKTNGFNQLKIWGPVGKGDEPNLEAVIFCGLCMSMLVFGGVLYLFLTFPVHSGMTMYLLISCKEKHPQNSALPPPFRTGRSHAKCC